MRVWRLGARRAIRIPGTRNDYPIAWRGPSAIFSSTNGRIILINALTRKRQTVLGTADPRGPVWVNSLGTELRWVWQARATSVSGGDDTVFAKSTSGSPAAPLGVCRGTETSLGDFSADGSLVAVRCFLHGG